MVKNKSIIGQTGDDLFKKMVDGEDVFIQNNLELAYACGLILRYILTREIMADSDKAAKRANMVNTWNSLGKLVDKTQLYIQKHLDIVDNAYQTVRSLASEIMSATPEEKDYNMTAFTTGDEQRCFFQGLIIENKWYKPKTSEKWQKEKGMMSKSYKLSQDVVEEFAAKCKNDGVKIGPKLEELMYAYVREN